VKVTALTIFAAVALVAGAVHAQQQPTRVVLLGTGNPTADPDRWEIVQHYSGQFVY
jgi:hypothetical protein